MMQNALLWMHSQTLNFFFNLLNVLMQTWAFSAGYRGKMFLSDLISFKLFLIFHFFNAGIKLQKCKLSNFIKESSTQNLGEEENFAQSIFWIFFSKKRSSEQKTVDSDPWTTQTTILDQTLPTQTSPDSDLLNSDPSQLRPSQLRPPNSDPPNSDSPTQTPQLRPSKLRPPTSDLP